MFLTRAILLVTAFCEGFVKFTLDALMFHYLRSDLLLRVDPAMGFFHLQLCVYYYAMTAIPSILPKRYSVYRINFVLCVSFMLTLVSLLALEMYWPIRHLSIDDDARSEGAKNSFQRKTISRTDELVGRLRPMKTILIMMMSAFCGAKALTIRHVVIKQFKLPLQRTEYNRFRVQRSTVLGLGRISGLILCVYFGRGGNDVQLHFEYVFLVLSIVAFCDCVLMLLGFGVEELQVKKPLPQGLLRFFKIQSRVIGKKLMKKQDSKREDEEWKTLIKVLPLFVPAIIVTAYRDQRYSLYQYQTEMLDPEWNPNFVLPPVFLNGLYPITKTIGTILFDGLIFARRAAAGKHISMKFRSIMGFVLVTMSLAGGTILHCHVEKTKRATFENQSAEVLFYNSMECPAVLTIEGIDRKFNCPGLSLNNDIVIELGTLTERKFNVLTTCRDKIYDEKTVLHLKDGEVHELFLSFDGNTTGVEKINTRSFIDSFLLHSSLLIFGLPRQTEVKVIGLLTTENSTTWFQTVTTDPTFEFHNIILPPDRYLFIVDNITLMDVTIGYGAAMTFMASRYDLERIPNTKLFYLLPQNTIPIYYQLPQIFLLGMSDVFLESSNFLYASNAVPKKWWNVVYELWLSCWGTGNLITALAVFSGVQRVVMMFLMGFGLCWMSVALVAQLFAKAYTEDYDLIEAHNAFKTKEAPSKNRDKK